jgi:hypothetical protein
MLCTNSTVFKFKAQCIAPTALFIVRFNHLIGGNDKQRCWCDALKSWTANSAVGAMLWALDVEQRCWCDALGVDH